MEAERARELLARERERIERALGIHEGESLESDAHVEPGDKDSEDLYQDEFDAGRVAGRARHARLLRPLRADLPVDAMLHFGYVGTATHYASDALPSGSLL